MKAMKSPPQRKFNTKAYQMVTEQNYGVKRDVHGERHFRPPQASNFQKNLKPVRLIRQTGHFT